MDRGALKTVTGEEIRQLCRRGEWDGPTAGLAEGYVQANLVVLPAEHAFDFWLFCHRNSRACPVLDVTGRGEGCPLGVAPDADLRTDLPRYRIFRQGEQTEETTSIVPFWREDAVAFLLELEQQTVELVALLKGFGQQRPQ